MRRGPALRVHSWRPDSIIGGRSVYDVRGPWAGSLLRGAAAADVVIPVRSGASGSAMRSEPPPYELGIIRNHYVGRTIEPTLSRTSPAGVRPHSANRAVVNGKRIKRIDDLIVRAPPR
jgi:glutamine phosphoribosylpyrophosphate amidotransferase